MLTLSIRTVLVFMARMLSFGELLLLLVGVHLLRVLADGVDVCVVGGVCMSGIVAHRVGGWYCYY